MAAEQFTVATSGLKKPWQGINCASVESDVIKSGDLTLPNVSVPNGDYVVNSLGDVLSLVTLAPKSYFAGRVDDYPGADIVQTNLNLSHGAGVDFVINPGIPSRVLYTGTTVKSFLVTFNSSFVWAPGAGPGLQQCKFTIENPGAGGSVQPGSMVYTSSAAYDVFQNNTVVARTFTNISPNEEIHVRLQNVIGLTPKIAGYPGDSGSCFTIVEL